MQQIAKVWLSEQLEKKAPKKREFIINNGSVFFVTNYIGLNESSQDIAYHDVNVSLIEWQKDKPDRAIIEGYIPIHTNILENFQDGIDIHIVSIEAGPPGDYHQGKVIIILKNCVAVRTWIKYAVSKSIENQQVMTLNLELSCEATITEHAR